MGCKWAFASFLGRRLLRWAVATRVRATSSGVATDCAAAADLGGYSSDELARVSAVCDRDFPAA